MARERTTTPEASEGKSGGLGLTRPEWFEIWGEGTYYRLSGYYYGGAGYSINGIGLFDDKRVSTVVLDTSHSSSDGIRYITRKHAETTALLYAPNDAVEVDRGPRTNGPGEIVVYKSAWLKKRFADLERTWKATPGRGKIGEFAIWYWVPGKSALGEELVERVFVTTGRNAYDNYGDT